MNTLKKAIALISLALLCLGLFSGCVPRTAAADPDKLQVVATIFPPYDFARQIGGENAQVTMLLPPGTESHSYDPTPQDIQRIQNCDVFLYIGGHSDKWAQDILDSIDTSGMQVIALTECVYLLEEETVEGMQQEPGEEAVHEEDAHVWTSPANAMQIVTAIGDAMIDADPEHAAAYEQNRKAYLEELLALDRQLQDIVSHSQRTTLLFGDRFPFRYLAEQYGLSYYAAFPGCASQTEPSAATLAFLIDKAKAEDFPIVFHMEFSNEKVADVICEATGAQKRLLHSCHNVTKDEFDRGETYLSLMEQNAANLKEALS